MLRILLRGKVKRLRKIVRGKSVASNEAHAIRSVFLFTETSGEINRRTLSEIEAELKEFGIHLIFADGELNSGEDPTASRDSFDRLVSKGCDGIIIWGTDLPAREILQIENEFPNITLLNNKNTSLLLICIYFLMRIKNQKITRDG